VHIVREIVHEDFVSDEASGPEDKAIESPAAWKVRMAVQYGEKDVSPATLKDQSFLEVLECPLRSDEVFHHSQKYLKNTLLINVLRCPNFRAGSSSCLENRGTSSTSA
jgi:hypothetical protein